MHLVPREADFPNAAPPPAPEPAAPAEATVRPVPAAPAGSGGSRLRGRYEVGEMIGGGGFGAVYLGFDAVLGRRVAIKICCRRDPDSRARFLREAAIGSFLDHRHLTRTHDFGSDGPTLFAVQEFLSGEDLSDLISRRRPRSLAARLDILVQVPGGLAHAHARGVLHRDLKPANVRVLEDGRVKVMDFGSATRPGVDVTLTDPGTLLGTLAYLAPEVLSGRAPGAASDVYAFGALAYELLSFRRPFAARTLHGLVEQVLTGSPAPLAERLPECPGELAALVHGCLSKASEDRPPGFAELERDLRRVLSRGVSGERIRDVA